VPARHRHDRLARPQRLRHQPHLVLRAEAPSSLATGDDLHPLQRTSASTSAGTTASHPSRHRYTSATAYLSTTSPVRKAGLGATLTDELHRQLRDGELIATARERPVGPRIDVPTAAWRYVTPVFGDSSASDGTGQIAIYDVRVAIAGLDAPAAVLAQALAASTRTDGELAPVYSLAVLRSWYRLRCAGWPATQLPPSEAEDRRAASKHFGRAIPRSALRAIRRELAPAHWLKPGPRKAPR
jgi:hypothetical protein